MSALIPDVSVSLKVEKPEVAALSGDDLAARLRRRRKELGLFRKQVARQMGICEEALAKWEGRICEPRDRYYPAIIAFLGYDPWSARPTLGKRIMSDRRRRGLSRKRAARLLGVDEASMAVWETDKRLPPPRSRNVIEGFLAGTGASRQEAA